MTFLSLLMAIVPTIIILFIVYRNDKEKEPKKLLLSLYGLGIVSCFITVTLSFMIEFFFPVMKTPNTEEFIYLFIYCFVKIAFVEEFCKWIFSYSIGWNNKEFDHRYDAIVYSVFVALGFATLENILYCVHYGIYVSFLRCIISVPSHAFFAIIMGYFISEAKFETSRSKQDYYMMMSLLIPTILHGVYDLLISIGNTMLIPFLVFVAFLYIFGIVSVKKILNLEKKDLSI